MPNEQRFTRAELYSLVWSTPISTLANRFGLSDVGFAKLCKRYDIPRPPRGHWAKLEFGKVSPITPLRANKDPKLETIVFVERTQHGEGSDSTPAPLPPAFDADIVQMLERAKALPKIVVESELRNPLPLIKASRRDDRERDERKRVGFINYKQPETKPDALLALNTVVFPESRERAYKIWDALIRSLEAVGLKVITKGEKSSYGYVHNSGTFVMQGDDSITQLRIREFYKTVERKRPNTSWTDKEKVATGNLILDGGGGWQSHTFCRDTGTRIEEKLLNAIIRIIELAGQQRIDKREREEAERKRQQKRDALLEKIRVLKKQYSELKAKQDAERAKVRDLYKQARNWRKSQEIRSYLDALSGFVASGGKLNLSCEEFALWLKWAHEQADRLDPLRPTPPSVLDEPLPEIPQEPSYW